MRRINSSPLWLKALCAPFLITLACGGISVTLYFTIGLPPFESTPIQWEDLNKELKASNWCFERDYDSGHKRTFCGVRTAQGKLMLEQSLDGRVESTPVSEYYADMEPIFGINRELYWEGFNIYYGFYPGASFIRNGVSMIFFTALVGGLLCALIICVVPAYLLAKSAAKFLKSRKDL